MTEHKEKTLFCIEIFNTLTKETGDMAPSETTENTPVTDDRSRDEVKAAEEETELYNIKNFSV